jgi:hypothetical protein
MSSMYADGRGMNRNVPERSVMEVEMVASRARLRNLLNFPGRFIPEAAGDAACVGIASS